MLDEDKEFVDFDPQILFDRYFKNSFVEVDWDYEGQRVGDPECYHYAGKHLTDIKGKIYIGARAGPYVNITNLCHEMSHFIEIDDERMNRNKWGLKAPEVYIFNRICVEPVTIQMSLRETRVAALQYWLQKSIGCEQSIQQLISSFKYLPDFTNVPFYNNGIIYSHEEMIENFEYGNRDEFRFNFLKEKCKEYIKNYSLEFFNSEWERKNKLLKEKYV
jgi:hypothetical protein